MNGFLLVAVGATDDLPVRAYQTLALAAGAARAFGIGWTPAGIDSPPAATSAAEVWGRNEFEVQGWKVVEFIDGRPVKAWQTGFNESWRPQLINA